MGVTNLTALNASAISIGGVPIAGSDAPGPLATNFDVLDVASVVALNGVPVQGTLPAGAIYTNYTGVNANAINVAGVPLSPSGGGPVNLFAPSITGVTLTGSDPTFNMGIWAASPVVDHFDVQVENASGDVLLARAPVTGLSRGSLADPGVGESIRHKVWAVTSGGDETLMTSADFGPFTTGPEFIGAFAFGTNPPNNDGYEWCCAVTAPNTITNNAYPVTNPNAPPYGLGWGGTVNSSMSGSGKSDPRLVNRVGFSTMTTPNCFFRIDIPGPGNYDIYMGFAATGSASCGIAVYESSSSSLGTLVTARGGLGPTVTGSINSTTVMGGNGTVHANEAAWAAASVMGGLPMTITVANGASNRLHLIRPSAITTQLCCVAVFKVP